MQQSQTNAFDFIWNNLVGLQVAPNSNISQDIQKYKQYLNNDYVNYSLGAMFGAFIGDALGSFLQFSGQITPQRVDTAMKMPGGGVFGLQPAQFTDDSQLASHLLNGLCEYNIDQDFQNQQNKLIKKIAFQYKKWFQSNPFDIGITTRAALIHIRQACYEIQNVYKKQLNKQYICGKNQLQYAFLQININNQKSQSNGSLMRITPMAFFISLMIKNNPNMKIDDFKNLIKKQINMTHGNNVILKSSQEWVKILVEIILRKEKGHQKSLNQIHHNFIQRNKNTEIKQWIEKSQENKFMDGVPSMGWAKIGFTYGIKHMQHLIKQKQLQNIENQQKIQPEDYIKILKHVMSKGGDTDTNGAIVGGIIGAIIGFKNLPLEYLQKQFKLRLSKTYQQLQAQKKHKKIIKYRDHTIYQPRLQFYRSMKLIKSFKDKEQKQVKKSNTNNEEINNAVDIMNTKTQLKQTNFSQNNQLQLTHNNNLKFSIQQWNRSIKQTYCILKQNSIINVNKISIIINIQKIKENLIKFVMIRYIKVIIKQRILD